MDLFGVEALSRGAKEVTFCDNSFEAIKIVKKNIENTKFEEQSTVIHNDYIATLKKVAEENKKFDIIFIDPPYNSDFAVNSVEKIIELSLLEKDGTIIIETDKKEIEEQISNNKNIKILNIKNYGRVALIFASNKC